jgi:transcription elongation factor/antiterminator RfaH
MHHWYALYTHPRAERQVGHALQTREIETYLPTVEVWRARRRRVEEEPLFAGYLFAHIDLEQVGHSAVAWTPGLRYIVGGEAGHPSPVPDGVITYIRHGVAEMGVQSPVTPFQPGEAVRIIEGPLKDLDAVFDQHLSSYERAQVLVEVLGRLTRYDVPIEWLKQI